MQVNEHIKTANWYYATFDWGLADTLKQKLIGERFVLGSSSLLKTFD
jgi:hypothetical protein